MSRFVYVNGRYVRHGDAMVHVEDRGFQFADSVYEVFGVIDGVVLDCDRHLGRLDRSLRELRIAKPMSDAALTLVMQEMLRRNRIRDGALYLQVSRGVAPRDHPFPVPTPLPTLVITVRPMEMDTLDEKAAQGIKVITFPDLRWRRCDIKTVGLLPNVLAIQAAKEAGAQDALLVDDDGLIMESTRANAWIVNPEDRLVTRQLDSLILHGITRGSLLEEIQAQGLSVEERAFSIEEAKTAREVFISSSVNMIVPVIDIDGTPIGNGQPGSTALSLRAAYQSKAWREATGTDRTPQE